jgi:ubiquitin conjugation factor E4 B
MKLNRIFVNFYFRYSTETVLECIDQSMVTWLLTCISSPHLIKNPYITAKLVEVLFVTSPTIQPSQKLYSMVSHSLYSIFVCYSIFIFQIMNHELAQTVLISALMKFYTDIETTGQSTEFYDKFTIRYLFI